MVVLSAWGMAEMTLLVPMYMGIREYSKESSHTGCFGGLKEGLFVNNYLILITIGSNFQCI